MARPVSKIGAGALALVRLVDLFIMKRMRLSIRTVTVDDATWLSSYVVDRLEYECAERYVVDCRGLRDALRNEVW